MADVLRTIFGTIKKRYRDMGDTSHAEVISVGGMALPEGAPIQGQVTVAETGTAVKFSATSKLLPGASVLVWASSSNDAAVTIGGSAVTNTVDGTGNGVVVPAGETRLFFPEDLEDAYLNGTAGDWISYAAA